MSRDHPKDYYSRDMRNSDRDRRDLRMRDRDDYRYESSRNLDDRKRRRSRSKDFLDDSVMSEISKLPEPSQMWQQQEPPPPPPGTRFSEPLPNSSYSQNYLPTYSGLYDDFPPVGNVAVAPQAPPAPQAPDWSRMQPILPPPPTPTMPAAPPAPTINRDPVPSVEDRIKKDAAIETEMRHQKAALSKQREDYMKKAGNLKKELETLKDQRNELRGDTKRSPSPDTKRFLKENTKLQLEIQNKLKTITNVVDMLNGIIGENMPELKIDLEPDMERERSSSKRRSRSPPSNKFNYVYYDPEMHWCRVCNEFPPTAKDYLNHLHSPQHHKMAAAHMEAPWHSLPPQNEGFPSYPSAPTKRTPIRGLQFFVPSTAWYCKLCDHFIGDLHCASAHLKSITHSKNYQNFVEQNPHWETDWMSDRQKALEKGRVKPKPVEERAPAPPPPQPQPQQYANHTITFHKDGFHTTNKDSPPASTVTEKQKKDKKKKTKKRKKSSSSSSEYDSSSSDSSAAKRKKGKKKPKKEDDGRLLTEWMSSLHAQRLSSSERRIVDSLKQRAMRDAESRSSPERSGGGGGGGGDVGKKYREQERRENVRRQEDRHRNEEHRRVDERRRSVDRRTDDRRRDRSPDQNKPKKMPFIGKMPVYKTLTKTKIEEQKKEEEKKKEDDECAKKRKEEMDAEIQKKVAEFKEKIAKAKAKAKPKPAPQTSILGPPPAQPPLPAPLPTLPKDFQEALDIIFPSDSKPEIQDGLFTGIPGLSGFPFQPFPGLGMMPPMPQMPPQLPQIPPQIPPQMPQMPPQIGPPVMMGVNMTQQHYPIQRPHYPQQTNNNKSQFSNGNNNKPRPQKESSLKEKENLKKKLKIKEEMDDLAMLGIDASDVGSGM